LLRSNFKVLKNIESFVYARFTIKLGTLVFILSFHFQNAMQLLQQRKPPSSPHPLPTATVDLTSDWLGVELEKRSLCY
jgi:hypothetical protein